MAPIRDQFGFSNSSYNAHMITVNKLMDVVLVQVLVFS